MQVLNFLKKKTCAVKLSCIYLLDEFAWNNYVPWQLTLDSALAIADEVVIVRGNHTAPNVAVHIDDYLARLGNAKIKIVPYAWKDDFSWFEIAHALNAGLLQCSGNWCFRLLMDEFIPYEQFQHIKSELRHLQKYDVMNIGRYNLLGSHRLCPVATQDMFFQPERGYCYGRAASDSEMVLLFDSPVNVASPQDAAMIAAKDAAGYRQRFDAYPPLGVRQTDPVRIMALRKFFINTDVYYVPDNLIKQQKMQSVKGYHNLPAEYRRQDFVHMEEAEVIFQQYLRKVQAMVQSPQTFEYHPPQPLLDFITRFAPQHNSLTRLFYGIEA